MVAPGFARATGRRSANAVPFTRGTFMDPRQRRHRERARAQGCDRQRDARREHHVATPTRIADLATRLACPWGVGSEAGVVDGTPARGRAAPARQRAAWKRRHKTRERLTSKALCPGSRHLDFPTAAGGRAPRRQLAEAAVKEPVRAAQEHVADAPGSVSLRICRTLAGRASRRAELEELRLGVGRPCAGTGDGDVRHSRSSVAP